MAAPLAGRRVLDLGALCAGRPHALAASMAGKLCAAYGAGVVRPRPPSGEPLAGAAPRLPDGASALDRFLNAGKGADAEGSEAESAFDVAIGDGPALERHAAQVPIRVRISVFGPGEDPPATELSLAALCGLLDLVGDADDPPARLAGHQIAYATGLAACTGLLAALHAGGEETVDVSLFDVATWLNWKAAAAVLITGEPLARGNARNHWTIMAARDGHVALVYQEKDWPALVGLVGHPALAEARFATVQARAAHRDDLHALLAPWFAARPRAAITAAAQARRIPIGPVLAPSELLDDAQHRARGFLATDGAPKLPLLWDGQRVDGRAPAAPASAPGRGVGGRPLAGIRVLDLGTITAGAGTSALLADLGADVVKVEGPGALDPFRIWDGVPRDVDWWNRSPYFAFTNRGKRSLCLDLKDPRGREVFLRLLAEADVLVENFRRGVLADFGLDARDLRRRFPRLVVASISSQGEDGPDRDRVSYGSTLEATGGLAALTGTGARPVITGRDMNYPDQVVCLFASGAVVAALIARARTGEGAHLDLSQRELTTFLLGEEMLAAASGVPSPRRGNHDPDAPDEILVQGEGGWRVAWPGGEAPVRDGHALVAAPEFARGTGLLRAPDGTPAKGVPFRLARRPLAVETPCRALGADNRAVLTEAGLAEAEIADLEAAGLVATGPRVRSAG